MHHSAILNAQYFYKTYLKEDVHYKVLDIGSQDINGSLKDYLPLNTDYTGVDFVDGKNVDVILNDPYSLPFKENEFDVILCSSCFEHSDMFWISFLEIMRILKPNGLFYLNVPSNGIFHYYPVDSWRFYPHSGTSLSKWAKRNGYNTFLLESYISKQEKKDIWNDFVGVFLKDKTYLDQYQYRILDTHKKAFNGILNEDENNMLNQITYSEDQTNIIPSIKNNYAAFKLKVKQLIFKNK